MGTKVQANTFLPDYHSVIDLDGNNRNGLSSLYHEKQIAKNGQDPESVLSQMHNNGYLGYEKEKVRQTILKHESIFKSQLQELHRLYRRQLDLMNQIKGKENKDDWNEENSQSISLFSSMHQEAAKGTSNAPHSSSLHHLSTPGATWKLFPSSKPLLSKSSIASKITYDLGIPADAYISGLENQIPERISKLPGVENTFRNTNHQTSYDRDYKSSASGVWTPQSNTDALKFNMYFKRNSNSADLNVANITDEVSDSFVRGRGDLSMRSCSNSHFVSKDLLQNSLIGINGNSSLRSSGLMIGRNGNELLYDDYAEKRKIDDHSAIGNFYSGKSLTYSESLLAEMGNESSNSPFVMGKPLSQRKRTIFGVEISEENEDSRNAAANLSSTILKNGLANSNSFPASLYNREPTPWRKIVKSDIENHRVSTIEPSSWIASPLVQDLELGRRNLDDGNNLRSKADEISRRSRFSDQSIVNGKWLQGCSSNGLNFATGARQSAESDPQKLFKKLDINSKPVEVLEPQHHHLFADRNAKGGLPWFLKKPQHHDEPSKGTESSYFMNVNSLQNYSQKFFGKSEVAVGSFQNSKQKNEISVAIQDAKGGINEGKNVSFVKKILGFPISDMHQSFQDLTPGENLPIVNCSGTNDNNSGKVIKNENDSFNQFETKNHSSDLRHHFDLNLSVEEEDTASALSQPTAIVKIATTETDLEAPVAIQSERKMGVCSQKSVISHEEWEKDAAEAIIALSSFGEKNWVNNGGRLPPEGESSDPLKWFAEIVSSQCDDTISNGACDEEDFIPNGMDYFEFMTLKLEETKEELYVYNPVVSNNPINEERADATFPKRSRRGQSRRGRQRKDFQRDILPGIVTLSRHEMNEDLQTFKELSKPESSNISQRNSTRNGRGRKRSGGQTTSPPRKAQRSTQTEQQPVGRELGIDEKSLTGWGKRTRRLPRQRCPNAYLSVPVKC